MAIVTTRVMLVDDHTLVRDMLSDRLSGEQDFSVVGVASSAEQALELVGSLNADLALFDIDMPGLNCFEATSKIMKMHPSLRVIFLSAFSNDHYIEQALQVGALGYLTKDEPYDRIVEAMRDVMQNKAYFSADIRARMVVGSKSVGLSEGAKTRSSTLTTREVEVLRYIARGLSKKDISALMKISVKTVDKHSENLMRKLQIHDRVMLSRFAIREGLAEA